jgi:hypothetical protein
MNIDDYLPLTISNTKESTLRYQKENPNPAIKADSYFYFYFLYFLLKKNRVYLSPFCIE